MIPTIDYDEPTHSHCFSGTVDLDETHESEDALTRDEFVNEVEGILDKVLEAWKNTTDKEQTLSNEIEYLKTLVKSLVDTVVNLEAKLVNKDIALEKVISKLNLVDTNTCIVGSENSLDALVAESEGLKLHHLILGSNALNEIDSENSNTKYSNKKGSASTKRFTCNFCKRSGQKKYFCYKYMNFLKLTLNMLRVIIHLLNLCLNL